MLKERRVRSNPGIATFHGLRSLSSSLSESLNVDMQVGSELIKDRA
jgi:hypothetical protein